MGAHVGRERIEYEPHERFAAQLRVERCPTGVTEDRSVGGVAAGHAPRSPLHEQLIGKPEAFVELRRHELVNHDVRVNEQTGEVYLDFLLSGAANGKLIVEWNAYRYATLKGGKPGIVLHGISRRAYGEDEAKKFLTGLQGWRATTLNELARLETPEVQPKP